MSVHAFGAAELLGAWERGWARGPNERALDLLTAAYPEMPPAALARLPIGRRDSLLLSLRARAFGRQVTGLATCPACGEQVEIDFDLEDVRVSPEEEAPDDELEIEAGGYRARFRLPTSLDLAAISQTGDPHAARLALAERCLLDLSPSAGGPLPAALVAAMSARMAAVDPQADVQLELVCPTCAHEWRVRFDIVTYLWADLDAWARRILVEVHTLASAYGWREADILALSPARRQFYLEMATG